MRGHSPDWDRIVDAARANRSAYVEPEARSAGKPASSEEKKSFAAPRRAVVVTAVGALMSLILLVVVAVAGRGGDRGKVSVPSMYEDCVMQNLIHERLLARCEELPR